MREVAGSAGAPDGARGVWLGAGTGGVARLLAGDGAPFSAILRGWLADGAPAARVRLVVRTGDAGVDAILAGLAPAFVAMLEHLTDRQREVARRLLLEGRRRAQIAEELGISRPTVSVMVDRSRMGDLGSVAAALDAVFAAAAASGASPGPR